MDTPSFWGKRVSLSKSRADVLGVFHAAQAAVHGGTGVAAALRAMNVRGPRRAVAVGKAACAKWEGARDALEASLIVTKRGHVTPACAQAGVTMIEAGPPRPDEHSLCAGEAVLRFITATPPAAPLLFLLSGGASSLMEVLPPGATLADLQRLNAWLLASGWPIDRMNAARRRLSCIKGGRLAVHVRGRRVLQLLISDVPGAAAADIGSGPLLPAHDEASFPIGELPAALQALVTQASSSVDTATFAHIETRLVARQDDALDAAAAAARSAGHEAYLLHHERLAGDAAAQGQALAAASLQAPPGVHVWGGETTVALPPRPGRGGRNQQLALAAATVLAGYDGICLLAAGTDGSDGPGGDAGALVDGGTLARGALEGFDAVDHLRRADAGRFLEASGDLIHTGPTGTNVTDLVIALKWADGLARVPQSGLPIPQR